MSDIRRWSAAKCERIQDKLDSTVAGPNRDPEMLLDILIAAWEEMHREAKQAQGSVSALRAAADAEAEAGDEARREATRLRAENTRLEAKVARLSADVNRLTTKGVEVAAEYRAFVDGLTAALNAHGVPAMPSWREAINYLAAHGGTP